MKLFADLSFWWLIPWCAAVFAGTFLYYRKQRIFSDGSTLLKAFLFSLRSLALILLGILLLGILIESRETKTQKPVLINLIDNSSSMLNYKDSSAVQKEIEGYTKAFNEKFSGQYEIANYLVDGEVATSKPTLEGGVSDLYKGFDFIFNQYYNRNIGAITFISDGNYNEGSNPLYAAEKISLTPVFTLGVGDTIVKSDHLIRNVSANDIAFYKNEFPVEIDVEANLIPAGDYKISVQKEGKVVKEQMLKYKGEAVEFHHVSFILEATDLGFVNYEVILENIDGESTFVNNRRSFFIEVIDSRSKVLLLSDAPHPDLTAIKQMISDNQNMEVESALIDSWEGDLKEYSLLILQLSGKKDVKAIIAKSKTLKLPVWYLLTSQFDKSDADQLRLDIQYPSGRSEDEVQVYLKQGFQLFEISDDLKSRIAKWPPLKVRFGKVNVTGAQVLLGQRIGPVQKPDPVLVFRDRNQQKSAILLGEGVWRWRIDEYAKTGDHNAFKELIEKTVQYLLVKQNKDPFRIKLPKRLNVQEEIIINAEFYNASMEQITTPEIDFELTDPSGKQNKFVFAKEGNGYVLSIGKLKEGKYSWTGRTSYNGKNYERSGEFVVQDVSIEKLATRADHATLKLISERTGGAFHELSNAAKVINEIAQRKDIKTITYKESSFIDLIDKLWLFILIIALLATEWFIRKYQGGY